MVNNLTLSWDRISQVLKHETKHLDKTFKKHYQKIKHKTVKHTIKGSPSVCEVHLKTHKLENICYHHLVKKHHETVNFC